MSEYTLSVAVHKLKKQYGMQDAAYLIFADLKAAGWATSDAWAVAFNGHGLNWPKAELLREMAKLEALDSVQARIAAVRGEDKGKSDDDGISAEELAKETSKEKILKKLVIAEKKAKYGSPEWLKIISLEADYNKIKQDEIDTENNTIHYFLPIDYPQSCEQCLLFKAHPAPTPPTTPTIPTTPTTKQRP